MKFIEFWLALNGFKSPHHDPMCDWFYIDSPNQCGLSYSIRKSDVAEVRETYIVTASSIGVEDYEYVKHWQETWHRGDDGKWVVRV